MTLFLGALTLALGIWAIYRGVDVRLSLLLVAIVLGILAGDPAAIARKFLETFSNERFVVPICTAMGFAYVLKMTECDQHLVHLLVQPLTHVRPLLVPGTIAVGFLVNIPIISQTSTAVTLGAVVIPILLAARIPRVTIGAVLLLGSSVGGELLNPGVPELRTVVEDSRKEILKQKAVGNLDLPLPGGTDAVVKRILPLNLLGLVVAIAVCWFMSVRAGRTDADEEPPDLAPAFRVNLFKAMIPMLPLVLLFLTSPPFKLVNVPANWLVERKQSDAPAKAAAVAGVAVSNSLSAVTSETPLTPEQRGLFDCRLIGAAMLIGVIVAALSAGRGGLKAAGSFFEGAGYGFANIISLIVAATCFGEGLKLIRIAALLGDAIEAMPVIIMPLAGTMPLAFGVLCGSGMASTQSLFDFFVKPALDLGIDPYLVGAVVSLASAAGRTMSPFAAVTLMSATLTKTNAMQLSARGTAAFGRGHSRGDRGDVDGLFGILTRHSSTTSSSSAIAIISARATRTRLRLRLTPVALDSATYVSLEVWVSRKS